MDGNYAMSPNVFKQLYVIRIMTSPWRDDHSCAYAFQRGKSSQVYQEMLQAVVLKMEELLIFPCPRIVITDFELAAIQSVSSLLGPHITTQGCFYHLSQSTWRKLQELGMTELYRNDDEVKHFRGMLDRLAFLP